MAVFIAVLLLLSSWTYRRNPFHVLRGSEPCSLQFALRRKTLVPFILLKILEELDVPSALSV